MPTKKTILIAPMNGWGHINACMGIAQELQSRGHRVVWAMNKAFKDKVTAFGFEEEVTGNEETAEDVDNDKEYWPQFMEKNHQYLMGDTLTMVDKFCVTAYRVMLDDAIQQDRQYTKVLDKVRPDLILIDFYMVTPSITLSGIPWVWLFSATPHWAFAPTNKIPPPHSGLPVNDDRAEWERFRNGFKKLIDPLCKDANEYYKSKGGNDLQELLCHPVSPYLNIYMYPQELDYKELHPYSDNWVRAENILRIVPEKFEIPQQLKQRPGKLIFLSMGTFGCANLQLMTRLTAILAKSQHKFIVSKGPVFASHELPDNMWGQHTLPQTAILPQVDLVITHGGNNTVTESFYFGKPMLVLPLFGDQLDNAQRVSETGLGLRLSPFHCTEHQLLSAVDRLVADEGLIRRMAAIGERIRASKDKQILSDMIEKLAN